MTKPLFQIMRATNPQADLRSYPSHPQASHLTVASFEAEGEEALLTAVRNIPFATGVDFNRGDVVVAVNEEALLMLLRLSLRARAQRAAATPKG